MSITVWTVLALVVLCVLGYFVLKGILTLMWAGVCLVTGTLLGVLAMNWAGYPVDNLKSLLIAAVLGCVVVPGAFVLVKTLVFGRGGDDG